MSTTFASSLDEMAQWRATLGRRLEDYSRFLADNDLGDESSRESLDALRRRLAGEKLIVAFVAEFSRGKSELINAIFFADTGRRVLPATPGRTTMCPVELGFEADEAPALALLPISTRLEGLALADLRSHAQAWTHIALDVGSPDRLSEALLEVTRTQWVSVDDARALGFWDDDEPEDNPPRDDEGRVEVPAWRHAIINYPHPLLKRGLVVMDTPGLNAIGAEPELTLSLLPSAHAAVFILGADTGVTKSDMTIWRDHLGSPSQTAYVVLNKIDALADPLSTPEQVREQIARQQEDTARTLGTTVDRVFPLSARQALAARIDNDAPALLHSRLPDLEQALSAQMLPQRRDALQENVLEAVQGMESQVTRRLGDQRRQLAEQMLELRGLRGKSSAKTRLMLERVDAETGEFEQCIARLQAVRMVHGRMLKNALVDLTSDRLREEVNEMQTAMNSSLLNLGAKKAFVALCVRLREVMDATQTRANEIHDMLGASFAMLNAEFGFGLAVSPPVDLERFKKELALIQRNYVQYLGVTQAVRLSQPKFMEQFRRMLVSKLRVVFENTSSEVELWNKTASAQVDSQLRERRRGFRRRRESLERIQNASGDLEQRISELEAQDGVVQQRIARHLDLVANLKVQAQSAPVEMLGLRLAASQA
jgi:transcriptional regulator of met regulon